MEVVRIPCHKNLCLGHHVNMRRGPICYDKPLDDLHTYQTQVNTVTSQFCFARSLREVCTFLNIPPEYALKVADHLIEDEMVKTCLDGLENANSFKVIFRTTFVQHKQYAHLSESMSGVTKETESTDSAEKTVDPLELSSIELSAHEQSDPKSLSTPTHWVSALEVGNEQVISMQFETKDLRLLSKIFDALLNKLECFQGDLDGKKIVALEKFAKKFDDKLKDQKYKDVNLSIHYCSYPKLEHYYATLSGMVDVIKHFARCCDGWSTFQSQEKCIIKAENMNCIKGTEGKKKSTSSVTGAFANYFQTNDNMKTQPAQSSDVDSSDAESFVVLATESDTLYFLRATLSSLKDDEAMVESFTSTAFMERPEDTHHVFDKIFKKLLSIKDAERKIQDFLFTDYFCCNEFAKQGNDILKIVCHSHGKLTNAIQDLDLITMPTGESLTDVFESDALKTVENFIENVSSILPKGQDVDLLLIGKTGHGKSSTGNSILLQQKFETSSRSTSVTSVSCAGWTSVDDRTIKVVDTPGVCDTLADTDQTSIDMAIGAISDAIVQCQKGFHALLIVLRYGVRMTIEERKAIGMLKCILGEDVIETHCICVITHGDNFEHENEGSFLEWCKTEKGFLGDVFKECDYRCVLFNNKTKDPKVKKMQLIKLMTFVDKVSSNGSRYTNSLFEFAQRERNRAMTEQKAPEVDENMIRDIQLVLDYLNGMVHNTNEVDKYRDELDKVKQMVENLHNKVTEIEGVHSLVNTVFSLAEAIHAKLDEIADKPPSDEATASSSGEELNSQTNAAFLGEIEAKGEQVSSKSPSSPVDKSFDIEARQADLQDIFDAQVLPRSSKIDLEVKDKVKEKVKEEKNCFPGVSTVIMKDGTRRMLKDLHVGDEVLVRCQGGALGYEPVYMFGHSSHDSQREFLVFDTLTASVSISEDHYAYCLRDGNEICVPAHNVKCGDMLLIKIKDTETFVPELIRTVKYERKQGLFAPFTQSGTVVVDGSLMSCYVNVVRPHLAHLLLAPVRQLHNISPQTLAWLNTQKNLNGLPRWIEMVLKFF